MYHIISPPLKVSCHPEAEVVVLNFLQQYFQLYDGDRREQLLEAYHEEAVMSMSVAYPSYHTHEVRACNTLKRYLTVGSRNLVRLSIFIVVSALAWASWQGKNILTIE